MNEFDAYLTPHSFDAAHSQRIDRVILALEEEPAAWKRRLLRWYKRWLELVIEAHNAA